MKKFCVGYFYLHRLKFVEMTEKHENVKLSLAGLSPCKVIFKPVDEILNRHGFNVL